MTKKLFYLSCALAFIGIVAFSVFGINKTYGDTINALPQWKASSTPVIIVPQSSNTYVGLNQIASTTPTGALQNGLMFYDTVTNKFRCYQNGSWTDCIGSGGGGGGTSTSSVQTIMLPLIANGTVAGVNATSSTTTFLVQGNAGVNPFAIASSTGTALLTVTQAGNVGIGTTTPSSTLQIYKQAVAGETSLSIDRGLSTKQMFFSMLTGSNQDFFMGTPPNKSNMFVFGSGGGATNNAALAGYRDSGFYLSDYPTVIGGTPSGWLHIQPKNSVTNALIVESGNVGIGTTTPASKLDVWGNLQVGTSSIANLLINAATNQVLVGTNSRLTIPQGTAPTLSAAGDIAVDTSNGGMFSFYANGRENIWATSSPILIIPTPTASENHRSLGYMIKADVPITITKVECLVTSEVSNTPSWTFSLPHSTSLGTASANVMTTGQACTSTTTPQSVTLGGDLTLGAGEMLWATSSAVSNASTSQIQIFYKYDN